MRYDDMPMHQQNDVIITEAGEMLKLNAIGRQGHETAWQRLIRNPINNVKIKAVFKLDSTFHKVSNKTTRTDIKPMLVQVLLLSEYFFVDLLHGIVDILTHFNF